MSNVVIWDILGAFKTKDGNRKDIIYGTVEPRVSSLKLVLNGRQYWPKLIDCQDTILWFEVVESIENIEMIEGYNVDGHVVYKYPFTK